MATSTPKQSRECAGVAILESFFSTHHREPTLPEVDQLLSQVQAIPGCETFPIERLIVWFKQKYSSLYSLTAEAIQHLTVLSENHFDPSDDLIKTWAVLLKANVNDIETWLQWQKKQKESLSIEPVQVPTPAQSTSPEPYMKQETPPLVKHEQSECKVTETDINRILMDAVTSATQEDKAVSPNRSPKTVSEFECMFAPYEQKMFGILNNLLQGS